MRSSEDLEGLTLDGSMGDMKHIEQKQVINSWHSLWKLFPTMLYFLYETGK